MKDHELILKIIEEVDPNDTAKLDEIDKRVHLYIDRPDINPDQDIDDPIYNKAWELFPSYRYTRSRDALKAIRPKGWATDITVYSTGIDAFCEMHKMSDDGNPIYTASSVYRPTEELTELHAIIQAIAWEREND